MKKAMALALAIILALGLTGCAPKPSTESPSPSASAPGTSTAPSAGTADNTTAPAGGEEIILGCLQDVSGPTSSLGKMVEAGARWALEEVNANGGIDGRSVKLITYDTKGDVNEAINAFTRAVTTDKVSAIIGPPVANIALAIAPISEQYNVPVYGFAIDSKCQIKEDGTPYKNMFLFQAGAVQQGTIMAQYAMKNGYNKFGIFYNEGNAYSLSLREPFISAVEAGGGTVAEQVSYTSNDKDFKTLLGKIIAADVDAVYAPNYTQELILVTQQLRALGYEGAIIAGLDANPPFNTLLGEDCDKIYYINNLDNTAPEVVKMVEDIKAKTGIDATNKFFIGLDVMNILAQAIGEVGDDPVALRDYAENLTGYEGMTGTLSIDPKTHMPTGLEMVMFTYEGTTPKMLERYAAE